MSAVPLIRLATRPIEYLSPCLQEWKFYSGSAAVAEGSRRFPPPWTEHAESFWVQDASGQTGWFYFRHHEETARQAKVLTRDEARRMAVRAAAGAARKG